MASRVRAFLRDVGPWTTGLVVCVWAVLVWVVLRAPIADYGIHVSVAERLIAGDRLYADVWDNKDPLYYQSLALARWVTPVGGWFLDVAWLAVVGLASYSLARSQALSRRMSVLVGWFAAPIIVVSVADASAGVLPGAPLALVSLALVLRGRPALAGLMLSFVPFFKITVFPVALAAFAVALIRGRDRASSARAAMGFGAGVVATLTLLGARGELGPYAESLVLNVVYSQEGQSSGLASLVAHLSPLTSQSVQVTVVTVILALTLVRAGSHVGRQRPTDASSQTMWWMSLWALIAVFAVLAATGKWPGHAKLLVVPAVLAIIVLAAAGPGRLRSPRLASTLAVAAVVVLMSGMPSFRSFVTPLEYARATLNLQGAISSHARAIQSTGTPATYARVGQGDDPAHAIGLADWDLACPRFQQYWWESPAILQRTRDCLPRAQVVLVTPDLYGPVTSPDWEAFQDDVEAILADDYECRPVDDVRICLRRDSG